MTRVPGAWFWEFFSRDLVQGVSLSGILHSGRTEYQDVEVLETRPYGRCLVLDGKVQSTEADEHVYHEALVHPLLVAHPGPRRVLVAGGGEGATLREVLRHSPVERATMVDLDMEVVELCRRYMPGLSSGAFDDARAELRVADARAFLRDDAGEYDALVLDLPDPIEQGPACLLYTEEFYRVVARRMAPGGGLVVQAGSCQSVLLHEAFAPIYRTLASVFPVVATYSAPVDSFGGPWGFVVATVGPDPRSLDAAEVDRRVEERVRGELRFYDGTTHEGVFRPPLHVRRALESERRTITDSEPLYVV